MDSNMNTIKIAGLLLLLIVNNVFSQVQDTQAYQNKLLELYQNQQYLEAADYIKNAQSDSTYSFAVLSRLGYSYQMARDYKNAEYYYLKALEQDSLDIAILSSIAAINHSRGNKLIARQYYEKILHVDSTHINTLYTMAGLTKYEFDSLGHSLATPYYEKAYTLQPQNIDITLDYTQHLSDQKEFELADRILSEALQYDLQNFHLAYKKAEVSFNLKNYKEAILYGRQVLDLGGIDPDVLLMLGRSFYHMRDYKNSLLYYEKLSSNQLNIGEVDLFYMAIGAKEMKQYKQALEYIDLALEQAISPNTVYYLGTKSDLHELNSEFNKAAAALQRSFNFEVLPINYYKLGLLYDFKIKNKQSAVTNYRRYLQQKPNPDDQEVIDYVKKRLESLK